MRIVKALKNHNGFNRYLKNSAWLMSEHVLRLVAGLLVGVWVARYLGPQQFGTFSYAIAFATLFMSIAKLGLDDVTTRQLIADPERSNEYLGTTFWLKIFGALLVMALIFAILPWTSSDSTTKIYILIIASGFLFQSFEIVDFYFQSRVQAKYVSISRVFQLTLSSIIKISLVLSGANLVWFVLVALIDQITIAVAHFFMYRYRNQHYLPIFDFDFTIALKLLKDSWPLILTGIVIMVYMRIDQVMIKEMLGDEAVGIYSAAVRVSEVFYFIPVLLTASLFPAIVNAKKESQSLFLSRIKKLYTFLFWLAVTIAIPMNFLSEWMIVLLYGDKYLYAGEVLAIHIWASVFVFLGMASSKWLLAENLQKYSTINTAVGAAVNISLNLWLIPNHGIKGAAIATFISYAIAAYFMNFVFRKTRPNFYRLTSSVFFSGVYR